MQTGQNNQTNLTPLRWDREHTVTNTF